MNLTPGRPRLSSGAIMEAEWENATKYKFGGLREEPNRSGLLGDAGGQSEA
jgi:hypothetical protein